MVTIVQPYGKDSDNQRQPLLLMKTETFSQMMNSLLKNFGPGGQPIINNMGIECGRSEVKQLKDELRMMNCYPIKKEILDRAFMRFSQMGWGKITVANFDPVKSKVCVDFQHNPFQGECDPAVFGGCSFLQGLIMGVVSEALNEEMKYSTPKCLNTADVCRLELESVMVLRAGANTVDSTAFFLADALFKAGKPGN